MFEDAQVGPSRRCVRLLLCLCLAATLAGCGQPRHAPASQGNISHAPTLAEKTPGLAAVFAGLPRADVAGRVVDDKANPVAGATVYLCYDFGDGYGARNRLAGQTTSGPDGAFRFERALVWEPGTEPAPNTNSPQYPQYVLLARDAARGSGLTLLQPGDPPEKVKIHVHPAKGSSPELFWVRDARGQSVTGARVSPYQIWFTSEKDYSARTITLPRGIGFGDGVTSSSGAYSTPDFNDLDIAYRVEKEGLGEALAIPFKLCTLLPATPLEGQVSWSDGSPAAEVEVRLTMRGMPNREPFTAGVLTDAAGHFRFSNIPVGRSPARVTVDVIDPRPGSRQVPIQTVIDVKPGDHLIRNYRFAAGCLVAGRVIDAATSQPLAGIQLYFRTIDHGRQLTTDREGRFQGLGEQGSWAELIWAQSRSGDYLLDPVCFSKDHEFYDWFANCLTRDITQVEMKARLIPLRTLHGRVIDAAGAAVFGAQVCTHGDLPTTSTDRQGRFTIKAPGAGETTELLAWSGGGKRSIGQIGLASVSRETDEVTVQLGNPWPTWGWVVNQERRPIPGFHFQLRALVNGSAVNSVPLGSADTDALGRFIVQTLHPRLVCQALWYDANYGGSDHQIQNCDRGEQTIDLRRFTPGGPVQFTVRQYLLGLSGRVVDPQGRPVAGASLRTSNAPRPKYTGGDADMRTGKGGEFSLGMLDRGKMDFGVSAKGFLFKRVTLEAGQANQVVVLEPLPRGPQTYRVSVRDTAGKPVPGAKIVMHILDRTLAGCCGRDYRWLPKLETLSDATGTAAFTWGCPAGSELVMCYGILACDMPGYDLAYQGVELTREFDIVIRLRPRGEPARGRVLDPKRQPVAGARVRVVAMTPEEDKKGEHRAWIEEIATHECRTDAEGRFALPRFSPHGELVCEVRAEGWATLLTGFTGPTTKTAGEFIVRPAGKLRGRVNLEGGGALPGNVEVGVRPQGGFGATGHYTPVGADGTYAITDLEADVYSVVLDQRFPGANGSPYITQGEDRERQRVQVKAGETSELNLTAIPCLPVAGTLSVTNTQGKPLENTENVVIQFRRDERCWGTGYVMEGGHWKAWLPVGEYAIDAYAGNENETLRGLRLSLTPGGFKTPDTLTTATLHLSAVAM